MKLTHIVDTSLRVTQQRSRLKKIALIADCLGQLKQEEIETGICFLSGELRQGKIGIGYSTIRKRIPRKAEHTPLLTILDVDGAFERIARTRGPGSSQARQDALAKLFAQATRDEQSFLQRLLLGELRQGAQEGVLIEAIAQASGIESTTVRRAWMLTGDVRKVAFTALTRGERGLSSFRLELLRPLQPMLAQTIDEVDDVLAQFGRAAFEYKFDGARVQVHREGDDIRVFTRNLNDVTARVPEIVEAVRALPISQILLDGEAIVLRPDGKPAPFQVTMRRFGRRLNVVEMRKTLPLSFFFFDLLHIGGEDLIDRPTEERLRALEETAPKKLIVPHLVTASVNKAGDFLNRAVKAGHEGIMAKSLSAPYEAGRRGKNWLKLKPFYTLDLVVLAAEWGSGRRQGWLSNLHLGARDPKGGYVMLGKTFKGMTDEMLSWQTKHLLDLEVTRGSYTVHVRPELVVEVSFDGVQESSHYPGGLALRFARVKRYRPDKRPEEADTVETVRKIYEHKPITNHY
ncbi:MAG: ATP-dependent DNA ligase [candidate division Zixibacteria bacterium]|nr:ATP-dependent DNA ligase [candidate division Zixibacteria bacterium]